MDTWTRLLTSRKMRIVGEITRNNKKKMLDINEECKICRINKML